MNCSPVLATRAVLLLSLLGFAHPAAADPVAELDAAITRGLENFELGEYAEVRDELRTKLEVAGTSEGKVVVRARLLLGAALVGLGDERAALAEFIRVLELESEAQLDPRIGTEAVTKVFARAKLQVERAHSCGAIKGIEHKQVSSAKAGQPLTVALRVSPELAQSKVSLHHRRGRAGPYQRMPMELRGECGRSIAVPGDQIVGDELHYYLEARTASGQVAARRASPDSPISVKISASVTGQSGAASGKTEVPDELHGAARKPRAKGCAGCASTGAQPGSFWVGLFVLFVWHRSRRLVA